MGLEEGWYLMSIADLERELARLRDPGLPPSRAARLSPEEAMAYRRGGNLPDHLGRTLRLVLRVERGTSLEQKRLRWEPDYLESPRWRRQGSHKVNVVPLRGEEARSGLDAWWQDPEMNALEEEWRRDGTAAGLVVPGEWRGFVFKTIAALRAAGRPVTAGAVGDAVERWLSPEDARRVRDALLAANSC